MKMLWLAIDVGLCTSLIGAIERIEERRLIDFKFAEKTVYQNTVLIFISRNPYPL